MKQLLKSFNNFLDPKLINEIEAYVDASIKAPEPRWKTSLWWEPPIRRATSPVPILLLPDNLTIPKHNMYSDPVPSSFHPIIARMCIVRYGG